MSPEELQVIQIAIIVLISIIALYQNQFLRKVTKKEILFVKKFIKLNMISMK